MNHTFLDTSGWFAALSPKESKHEAARSAYRQLLETNTLLVTTNLVVAEMQILLTRFRGAEAGLRFLDSLYQDPQHQIVFVDRDLELAAVDNWLRRFTDQRLSLADAVSFEVMQSRGMLDVLALDNRFRIAGFTLVL